MIINTIIREKIGVAPIVAKTVKCHLRWFGHVIRIPMKSHAKMVDHMKDSPMVRDRGRQKETVNPLREKCPVWK